MIVLTAKYLCKPNTADTVEKTLQKMVSLVKQEPGCKRYLVNRRSDNPDEFLLFEEYEDDTALAEHTQTEYFQRYIVKTVIPLLEKRERALYTPVQEAGT